MINYIMNKGIFLLFLILITLTCGEKIEGPAIRFDNEVSDLGDVKAVYNFGEIKNGGTVSHSFSYFNPGSDTLVIKNVLSTCPSCTIVEEYDQIIAPGKKGKIRVTYKAKGVTRPVHQKIYITTNIPDGNRIAIMLKGNLIGKEKTDTIKVVPHPLNFGRLEPTDSIRDCSVRVKNFFEKPLFIADIIPPHQKTEVWVETAVEGREYIIHIRLHFPFKKGKNIETITLKTNFEEQSEILVPYVYSFNPEE